SQSVRGQQLERHFTTVEKNGRSAVHVHRTRPFSIEEDSLLNAIAVDVAFETLDIKTDPFRITFKHRPHIKLSFPRVLILEYQRVHFPKLPLHAGSFGGRCRGNGVVMGRQRKLAESDV